MTDALENAILEAILDLYKSVTGLGWLMDDIRGVGDMARRAAEGPFFAAMVGVGSALLLCMFYIHLLESALKDRGDPDSLIKEIAMLGVYAIVILSLDQIIPACVSITDGILNRTQKTQIISIGSSTGENNDENDEESGALSDKPDEAKSQLRAMMFGDDHGRKLIIMIFDAIIFKLVGTLVIFIVQCICSVTVITIKIEIAIRTALMPLAVGFIAEDGWRGPGGRFIKKWCACLMQTVIIAIAFQAYGAVVFMSMGGVGTGGGAGGSGGGAFFVALLSGGFALAGICIKSGQLANDVMGV